MGETKRFKNAELRHLEKNVYSIPYHKYEPKVENISLFLANNPYSEVEHLAKQIVKLVKNEDYRYKEIAVITKNIDTYSNLCKAIFKKYDIPVFIDEKKDLTQNVLVKFVLSVIDIFIQNWSYESVFSYIKTGLVDIDMDTAYYLENYCLKWGIKGSKWYKGEWNFYDESEEEIQKIKYARSIIVEPLMRFKNDLLGIKDVKSITKKLYEYLIQNNIPKKLEEKIEKLLEIEELEIAKEYESSFKILTQVFDEIVLVLGESKVTFEKYAEILKIGLRNSDLGKIPTSQDEVIIGDIDRSRSHKVKAVFIIGVNDGVFPTINKNEGFFDDSDREKLKKDGIELAKGTTEKLYDDNFNIYKALTTAEEKLYLSYPSSDAEGKAVRPSVLINKVKKIFTNVKEHSDIITNEEGKAVSKMLPLGKYKVIETKANEWYMKNEEIYEVSISSDNEIVKLNITNKSKDPKVDINKKGPSLAYANQEIRYDFEIRNTGNVELNDFTWYEFLPFEYGKATRISTGTYNQELSYNVYYRTNKKPEYLVLAENLSTKVNNYIDLEKL